jgi:hypothetical protein
MKNWGKGTFIGIVAVLTFIITLIACDDGNKDPTYDSVVINLPTSKADTVKAYTGVFNKYPVDDGDISNITFYGSGANFTATVNGKNNPQQSVSWEIIGNVNSGTNISNGILTVAIADHGKTFSIKATSIVDTTKSDTVTITAVKDLPSDFFGKWEFPQSIQPGIIEILHDKTVFRLYNRDDIEEQTIYWEPFISTDNEFPVGYFIANDEQVVFFISVDKTQMVGYERLHNDTQYNGFPNHPINTFKKINE